MAGLLAVMENSDRQISDSVMLAAASAAPHRFGASPTVRRRGSFTWVSPDPKAPLSCEFSAFEEASDSGLIVLVHGILDNRAELRHVAGDRPSSCSDAELVLHGYRASGRSFLASLIGNVALVIRDPGVSSMIALQDPMWMRPLYYAESEYGAVLTSEIKQIQVLDSRFHAIDHGYIARFLCNLDTPLHASAYQGVRLVEPGRMLVWSKGRRVKTEAAADPAALVTMKLDRRTSFEDAVVQLRAHLREVTADIISRYDRIGVFLSGGTDSMGAAALAASYLQEIGIAPRDRLHAYCFNYAGFSDADERHISRQLTDHYGIPFTEIPVRASMPLTNTAPADSDDPRIGVFEELFERTCQIARSDGMTAMLSGNRGDLVFGEMVYDLFGPGTGRLIELRTMQENSLPTSLQSHYQIGQNTPSYRTKVGFPLKEGTIGEFRRWPRSISSAKRVPVSPR